MLDFSPLAALYLWFFSQTPVLYLVFVPLMALCFFVGLMQIGGDRK
jgi:hypothetical protein